MAIQIIGNGGTVAEVDGTTWRAMRVTDRPVEFGSGGYYRVAISALTAAAPAAGAPLVSLRWTSGSLLFLLRYLQVNITVTTASTAGIPQFAGFAARSMLANDTGGTAVSLAGNNFKKRTAHNTTSIGDFRYAAAGVLTAGSRRLDANAFLTTNASLALGSAGTSVFDMDGPGDHPLVLAQNEGIVFTNVTALTAGVYQYTINMAWAEVPAY